MYWQVLESVMGRWKEFEELMNEKNEEEWKVEEATVVEVAKISKDEVRRVWKTMKNVKTVGPDVIPVEVWKCPGEVAATRS